MTTFQDLNIIEPILKSLHEEGYTLPTPIQAQSVPVILRGSDLLGCAQTGTGKTAAFAIPILQLLNESPSESRRNPASKRKIRSLILTPTRELAIQIEENFKAYGRYTRLKTTVVFGGVNQFSQTHALKNGIDILIATPGRLLDLMDQGHISLRDIRIFVLDEADRMLDMGFIHDMKKVIASLPKNRQTLFFSATMPPEIRRLSDTILNDPEKITISPVSSTVEIVDQKVYFVDKGNKSALLVELLKNKQIKNALVFTRTKHGADKICRILSKNRIQAEAIHGNKSQNARQKALTMFKNHSTRILVATEIAARGIDVENMEYVFNYDLPNVPEMYVHRIGRTGRAGAGGTAISFCDATEKPYLKDIEKLIAKKLNVVDDHPFPLTDHHPEPPKARQSEREGKREFTRKNSAGRNNPGRHGNKRRENRNRLSGKYNS